MQHVQQGEREAALDLVQLLESDRRFVELIVLNAIAEDLVDQFAQVLRRDFPHRTLRCLDAVGEVNDGALFELWLRTVVAIGALANLGTDVAGLPKTRCRSS